MAANKIVLIDLSGTIHIGDQITPGAVQALNRLRSADGVEVKFVTNTTKESRRLLHSRLIKLGFEIKKEEIVSSLWAARQLVDKQSLKPFYLVDDEAIEEFEGLTGYTEGDADCVVIGLAPEKFNRIELNEAFRILMGKSSNRIIAIHDAKYYRSEDGNLSLGPGAFVKMLQYATGSETVVVGKPSPDFFKVAVHPMTDMSNIYMIGDDVAQDVGGAQNLGIKGYLVRTGKYQQGDENKISPPPFKTVDNFAEAVDDFLKQS